MALTRPVACTLLFVVARLTACTNSIVFQLSKALASARSSDSTQTTRVYTGV
ncbi:hypothetical protein BV25DRAFT_1831391 [Artomyces pyxidatus]|uniref:Uncharacterized protein n=1 Tax=Artomyces pyxidatus TaxID=48021 RepID=A0ACB8SMX4_9AGAM|nr:hypothetical protein BV25DRAFT_1831391 [Artomyces pyxidatus]